MTTLADLKSQLDRLLDNERNSSFHTVAEATALLKYHEAARGVLEDALSDDEHLSRVVLASYIHPNGFDKIVLISSDDPQYRLRLHIWWPQPCPVEGEDVHNHRWDFGTVLLCGGYQYEQFERAESGEQLYEYSYASPDGSDAYTMNMKGPATLTCTFSAYMPQGSTYVLSSEVLHRVVNVDARTTATLMVQGPTLRGTTNVFKKKPLAHPSMEIPLERFGEETMRLKIRRLLSIL